MFANLLETLRRHEDLTTDEAAAAMASIMDGEAQPAHMAALLMALAPRASVPAKWRICSDDGARAADALPVPDVLTHAGLGDGAHLQRLYPRRWSSRALASKSRNTATRRVEPVRQQMPRARLNSSRPRRALSAALRGECVFALMASVMRPPVPLARDLVSDGFNLRPADESCMARRQLIMCPGRNIRVCVRSAVGPSVSPWRGGPTRSHVGHTKISVDPGVRGLFNRSTESPVVIAGPGGWHGGRERKNDRGASMENAPSRMLPNAGAPSIAGARLLWRWRAAQRPASTRARANCASTPARGCASTMFRRYGCA